MYEPYYDNDTGAFQGVKLDNQSIPKADGNRDWRKFRAWYDAQDPMPFTLADIDPPTQAEKDAERRAAAKAEYDAKTLAKAIVLVMLDEINALRARAGLPERTAAQAKTAIEAKIDGL